MSIEKQIEEKAIEEMAKVIERTEQIARDAHCGLPSPRMYAKDLYWHGYRKQSEWISVEERLPNPYMSVLVYMPGEAPFPTVREGFLTKHGAWYAGGFDRLPDEVAMWKEMPEAPKMKGGAE